MKTIIFGDECKAEITRRENSLQDNPAKLVSQEYELVKHSTKKLPRSHEKLKAGDFLRNDDIQKDKQEK